MMFPVRRRTGQHRHKPLTSRVALMKASTVIHLLLQSQDYKGRISQGHQVWAPLRTRERKPETVQLRPLRKSNQTTRTMWYIPKVRKARQGHKLVRAIPRKMKIIKPKMLPRRRPPPQNCQLRPLLRQWHQVLQLQRRQPRRPPAYRHVFAKSTAVSAALRGCVPRCCSPHPRWRTPLWAEEVYAGCACQHLVTGICARLLWSDVTK
ncbi:hypothetical protein ECC02_006819 [Trypanosoma cruzi]|uniref:Uncharacterized protein n=1 Tax=Trypanosoma cruzi TaxID=5693 RepID=A0A7J6Y055_TRYCR|nr:hypothetical protein ECC02_006819 [Trypanosoma cruzi]